MFCKHLFINDLVKFANDCGYELEDFRVCEDGFRVLLKKNVKGYNCIKYPIGYKLTDYYIESLEAEFTQNSTNELPTIQRKWRKFLKHKFGKNYVKQFNAWLDEQKLSY